MDAGVRMDALARSNGFEKNWKIVFCTVRENPSHRFRMTINEQIVPFHGPSGFYRWIFRQAMRPPFIAMFGESILLKTVHFQLGVMRASNSFASRIRRIFSLVSALFFVRLWCFVLFSTVLRPQPKNGQILEIANRLINNFAAMWNVSKCIAKLLSSLFVLLNNTKQSVFFLFWNIYNSKWKQLTLVTHKMPPRIRVK